MNDNQLVILTLTMGQFNDLWNAMEIGINARKGATVAPYEPDVKPMQSVLDDLIAQWRPQYTESIK